MTALFQSPTFNAGLILFNLLCISDSHYLPGVTPKSFSEGEVVKLKVNKMTSHKTLYPVNYYKLPFCVPSGGPKMDSENLGEFLSGDRIESSPYVLRMKKDMYCEQVCVSNLGRAEIRRKQNEKDSNRVVGAIRREYHNNWIVDNLPAASIHEDEASISTQFYQGFPVGYVDKASGLAMVNNHVNIKISYHPIETNGDKFRVVRFMVEPFSIAHQFDDESKEDLVKIKNPIKSCAPESKSHTSWQMLHSAGANTQQVASGRVLFTYDVIWEQSDVKWGSRWDVYLDMDHAIPERYHWYNLLNTLLIVLVLTVMMASILARNLRRDLVRYSRVATDEEKADDLEDYGWKLVHADVFRPPSTSPLLLSVMCGTGAQLLGCSLLTLIFSAIGYLNPSYRGSTTMGLLLCFVILGGVAGYVSARYYKTFKGKSWQKCTTLTATLFPGICFGYFFFIDLVAVHEGSTEAVPFTYILVLLILWFGVSAPLVFFGAYIGYRTEAIEFPVNTSSIPRQVPDQPIYLQTPFLFLAGGVLPFGCFFMEYYFLLSTVWMEQYYYVFGILFIVWVLLLLVIVEVAAMMNYFSLCNEEYHWWWRSFLTGSSFSLYAFLYSAFYFVSLTNYSEDDYVGKSANFSTYLLYFGYMGLACMALFQMLGYICMEGCLWFNKKMFGSIKVD